MFKRFWWMFPVMLPTGALAGFLVAALTTYLIPKQYESQAVIKLRPLHWDMPIESTEGEGEAPAWVVAEIEEIRNNESLDQVIARLELEKRWKVNKEKAREILDRGLIAHSIRGTDLVAIRMRHTSKADARDIVLEIVNVCKERRDEMASRETERRIRPLKEALGKQEEKVEALIQLNKESDQSGEAFANVNRELEGEREMLEALKLKLMGETIAAKIPNDRTPIHEMPRISHEPVFPNVTLNLVLGAVLGILLSPLLAIMIIRRRTPTAPAG